jgi:ABC-2 type transport system permease protein
MLFTSKIFECSSTRSPKAYFLFGNGEHSPSEAAGAQGYSKFAAALKNENNFELQALDLVTQKEVPQDCSLLIIAGPVQAISEEEADRIGRYLDGGGRLLVLFSHRNVQSGRPTGLEKLLGKWGIEIGHNIVLDVENASLQNGFDPKPIRLGDHPIVSSLGGSRVHFILPRSVRASEGSSRRREETSVDEILFTGPKTETVPAIDPRVKRTPTGPLSLAVVVERSIPAVDRGATRIVAIGDSSFWSNEYIEFDANREFASLAVNWLVQQNIFLNEIPRRAIGTYKLSMTHSQLRTSRLLLLLGMPLAVLAIGFVVWIRRRK